jgi:predicted DNA binding protein
MIPTGDALIPYFWIPEDDTDAVYEALRGSPLCDDVQVVDRLETETLFRVDWATDLNGVIGAINESEAVLLEARGHGDQWSFRMRFPDRQGLSTFYQRCLDQDVSLELTEVNDPFGSLNLDRFGLTNLQRETLLTALERGYFSVPREITLRELAEEIGISDTACSQRLRRGLTAVLSSIELDGSRGSRVGGGTD